jgi:hypothetical protein
MADSVVAESSDDKTADDFAALLLKDRKKRLLKRMNSLLPMIVAQFL